VAAVIIDGVAAVGNVAVATVVGTMTTVVGAVYIEVEQLTDVRIVVIGLVVVM